MKRRELGKALCLLLTMLLLLAGGLISYENAFMENGPSMTGCVMPPGAWKPVWPKSKQKDSAAVCR